MTDILIAVATSKTGRAMIAAGFIFAAGFTAATQWERHAPFGRGLAQKLDKARTQLESSRADLDACKGDVSRVVQITKDWRTAYDRLQSKREAEADAWGKLVDDEKAASEKQCRAAFSAGVTAGRAIGGTANGQDGVSSGADRGRPGAGVVLDDFAGQWGAGRADP